MTKQNRSCWNQAARLFLPSESVRPPNAIESGPLPEPGARAAPDPRPRAGPWGSPSPASRPGRTPRFHEGPSLATAACRGTRFPGKGRDAFPGSFPGDGAGRPENNPENHRPPGRPSHSPLAARGTRDALRLRCGRIGGHRGIGR